MKPGLNTPILPTHTAALFEAAVRRAADLLRAGELVALPTETVYGLAANALDPRAVSRIFAVKGRPAHNPIIIHVADLEMAKRCVALWNAQAARLALAFWPGPLTLVLPRAAAIPELVTAGGPTVGVRWPSHPLMQAVIRACGFPLAAPSANLSNRISPTTAAHVQRQLGGKIPLIVDGGSSQVGIESTVVDLTVNPLAVLRPGMIHAESLWAALGPDAPRPTASPAASSVLRSPGLFRRHYSPKAKVWLLAWADEPDLQNQLRRRRWQARRTWVISHAQIPSDKAFMGISVIPHEPEAFARAWYAELHRCDEEQPAGIVVEKPPETPEWQAINDRLARAAEPGRI